jgi:hypothetical protein
MNKVLVGVVTAADFARAGNFIPELSNHSGYDDWLDSRYGCFMGLSLGGVEGSLVTVALDDFLGWCGDRDLRPSEAAPDATRELGDVLASRQLGTEDVAKDLETGKDRFFADADIDPDRAGKLAVDERRRDPGVRRIVIARIIKLIASGARKEPDSAIGFKSQPKSRGALGRRSRDPVFDSLR